MDVPDQVGEPLLFEYRGKDCLRGVFKARMQVYNQADGISYPPFSNVIQFCQASPTSIAAPPNVSGTCKHDISSARCSKRSSSSRASTSSWAAQLGICRGGRSPTPRRS